MQVFIKQEAIKERCKMDDTQPPAWCRAMDAPGIWVFPYSRQHWQRVSGEGPHPTYLLLFSNLAAVRWETSTS